MDSRAESLEADREVSASPLLARPGAVPADAADAAVAAHYGDPLREQRALDGGTPGTLVDLSHKGVLTVSGPDRLSWLTTLSSQVLTGLAPGTGAEVLFLTVQGRVEFAPHVVDDGERTWLLVEPGEADGLRSWLESMRFALRVEVADVTEDWAVVGGVAPVPALSSPVVWQDPWPGVVVGGAAYTRPGAVHPGQGRRWVEHLVPRSALPELAADHDWAGLWAAEALRVEHWRPRWGFETDDRLIPHEVDWMRTAVHLSKGCYKGQETVARVHNLGHPPRRLVFLDLDGSEHTLPVAGDEVSLAGRTVGRVTTAAWHHEAGPVALALVKRSTDPQAVLQVGSEDRATVAAQTVVVDPGAGNTVGRPEGLSRGLRPPR